MAVILADGGEQTLAFLESCLQQFLGSYADSLLPVLKIIGINIILSGDNAVVIALACRNLPPRQRALGIVLGAGAAVVLRIIFTVLVQYLLDIPWLKLVGGLLLLWIAVKLLMTEEADGDSVRAGNSLFEAVKIVAIADIVMSLDNVLAIAAAAGNQTSLVILGLVISIPLVVFGAAMIMALLTRFPILVWAGAALLGWVAGELLATEPTLRPYMEQLAQHFGVTEKVLAKMAEAAGAAFVILSGLVISSSQSRKHHPAE
jgi:YjbE family integral membrane protein